MIIIQVEVDDSSDSEIEAKEDLEQDDEVKPESRKVGNTLDLVNGIKYPYKLLSLL